MLSHVTRCDGLRHGECVSGGGPVNLNLAQELFEKLAAVVEAT